MPPGQPGNHPVNRPISSSSTTPHQPPSGAPAGHPISLATKRFPPLEEPQLTDVTAFAELPPLPEMSYDQYDAADESDDLSDWGGAEGKPPIRLKQTEFSLKQFAKRMGLANFSEFNKWKKVSVAGFLEKKHRSIIRRQNHLKLVRDGPLHWEMVVADLMATFENWLQTVSFNHAELIRQQWVEMVLKNCASEIRESRKKGRQGNLRPATDLGEHMCRKGRSNPPALPDTMFTIMICWVSNSKDTVQAPEQLQPLYINMRHWEELVDFIDKNCSPKESYILTAMFKCTLEQDKVEEEYIGLYTHMQMINDGIYGQISYNCCLSNALKLELEHNVKICWVEMMTATEKEIAEHVIMPRKVIPANRVKARRVQQLIVTY